MAGAATMLLATSAAVVARTVNVIRAPLPVRSRDLVPELVLKITTFPSTRHFSMEQITISLFSHLGCYYSWRSILSVWVAWGPPIKVRSQ